MQGYKEPGFQERAAAAARARNAALEKLRARPVVDQAELDRRIAAQAAKEAAAAEKREAVKRAREEAALAKAQAEADGAKAITESAEAAAA